MSNQNKLCIKIKDNEETTLLPNLFLTDEQIKSMNDENIGTGIYKDIVGSGGFGVVYKTRINENSNLFKLVKIRELLNIDIAIKKIQGNKFNFNEIKLLIKTQNLKYSCKYYCCLINKSYVYIIMEYINGINLFFYQAKISEEIPNLFNLIKQGNINADVNNIINPYLNKVNMIIMQLAFAIEELHRNKIYHNDIKLENIMVIIESNGALKIKLFDYGLACDFNEDIKEQKNCGTKFGTPGYIIKEFSYTNNKTNINYEKKIAKKDWWAFGYMLCELLFNYNDANKEITSGIVINDINALNTLNTPNSTNFYKLLMYLIINKQNTILNHSISVNTIQQEIFSILEIKNSYIEPETQRKDMYFTYGENNHGGGSKKNKILSKLKLKLKLKSKLKSNSKLKLKSKSKLKSESNL